MPGDIQWVESRASLAAELAEQMSEEENESSGHCGPYGTTTPSDFMEDAIAYVDRIRAIQVPE